MEVLSSCRSAILSGYPDFPTICAQQQTEDESIDFQFFPLKQMFLKVNKKSGLELHQIKHVENKDPQISRVKKMEIDNLYCAACPKQTSDEIALGYSDGNIKLMNYKTAEFTEKFSSETSRNSVIFLDYNGSNEYLSSVQENGAINLYGLKTKKKLETLFFDNNCILSRFHPTKKFHMAATSSKGSVFVHDMQSKRLIYKSLDCHEAPCKDVCMSPAQPDVMISVGYDCRINIFDTRKKTTPYHMKLLCPLSTIAMSDCGYFICVGNLKGELISYDLRNAKTHLYSAQIHDGAVVRVAFVPFANSANENSNSINTSLGTLDVNCEQRKSVTINDKPNLMKRDSFGDFLEFHSYKLKATTCASRFSARRDSFDWELLSRKNPDPNTEFRMSTANRLSSDSQYNVENKTRKYVDFDSIDVLGEEENLTESKQLGVACSDKSALKLDSTSKKYFLSEVSERRLNYIEEEKEEDIRYSGNGKKSLEDSQDPKQLRQEDQGSDKENMLNFSNKELEGFFKLPEDRNSTPNSSKRVNETKASSKLATVSTQDLMSAIQKYQNETNSKLKQMEFEIKYNADCNKSNIFAQNFNLWRKQMDIIEEIQASVECLLQTDPFVNEFLRLQNENEQLKKALLESNKSK